VTLLVAFALRSPAPASVTPGTADRAAALAPVDVSPPPPSAVASRDCPAVISHLPQRLAGKPAREARSSSPYVASWGEPPLVLRCGVPRPAGFTGGSELTVVNGVQWLPDPRPKETVWTAVDRGAYVELTIPGGFTGSAVVELSAALTQALPARKPDPGR
jgi:uncharacterized protein DUF3515